MPINNWFPTWSDIGLFLAVNKHDETQFSIIIFLVVSSLPNNKNRKLMLRPFRWCPLIVFSVLLLLSPIDLVVVDPWLIYAQPETLVGLSCQKIKNNGG